MAPVAATPWRSSDILLLLFILWPAAAVAVKLPFRAGDVLPVLPRQISWPMLNTFHSAVDLLPSYVGSVFPDAAAVGWKGACFADNLARLELTPGDRATDLGGARIRLKTNGAHSWTCMDLYVFATPYRIIWDYYFSAREHTLAITSWEEPAEIAYVKQHGISVFLMPAGMLGTLLSLVDVVPLFSNTVWGQSANIGFLEKHMGASFEKRPKPWRATINVKDVHSGDFLAVSKIRGRWGGFETLEKWVTGAFAGHTAVCLKDESGNLWVGESGHENEKGEEVIAVIPWDEWWNLALKDDSNPQIALLPLHPDVRAMFNASAAWAYARSMMGKPYGYHNMIFSWIDTVAENYPPPLDANLVMSVMSMWTRLQPAYAANMWNEALNKRLGTEDLDLHAIIAETERRGMTFDQLLTIPEQDEWVYSDGKSTTCVAFILQMYKEAGVFGPMSNSIQVTEFTVHMDFHPGPLDGTVLYMQDSHRSGSAFDGDKTILRLRRYETLQHESSVVDERLVGYLRMTGFYGLRKIGFMQVDTALITALVERWRQETHTFHLPVGECTITLQDVEVLLGLPVDGRPVVCPPTPDGEWKEVLLRLLGKAPQDNSVLKGGRIKYSWLLSEFSEIPEDADQQTLEQYVRAYLFMFITGTLFTDASGSKAYLCFLPLLENLAEVHTYCWGTAALSWLYRNMCSASKKGVKGIGGCVLLLQLWAFEHLTFTAPTIRRIPSSAERHLLPLGYRWSRGRRSRTQNPAHVLDMYRFQMDSMLEEHDIGAEQEEFGAEHEDIGQGPALEMPSTSGWASWDPQQYQMPSASGWAGWDPQQYQMPAEEDALMLSGPQEEQDTQPAEEDTEPAEEQDPEPGCLGCFNIPRRSKRGKIPKRKLYDT